MIHPDHPGAVVVPFTEEEVAELVRHQDGGWSHGLTCAVHSNALLQPTTNGLVCTRRTCDYRQEWAPAGAADPAVNDAGEATLRRFLGERGVGQATEDELAETRLQVAAAFAVPPEAIGLTETGGIAHAATEITGARRTTVYQATVDYGPQQVHATEAGAREFVEQQAKRLHQATGAVWHPEGDTGAASLREEGNHLGNVLPLELHP